jgi:hypothetical protein
MHCEMPKCLIFNPPEDQKVFFQCNLVLVQSITSVQNCWDILRSQMRLCGWLRQCVTSRKAAGSIPECFIGISHWRKTCGRPMILGSTQPATEMSTVQLKCDDTRWRKGGEVKGKLANGVGSQYSSHYLEIWCIQHYYHWCAHLGCQ